MSLKTARKVATLIGAVVDASPEGSDLKYVGQFTEAPLNSVELWDNSADLVAHTLQALKPILEANPALQIEQDGEQVNIGLWDAEEQHLGLDGLVECVAAFLQLQAEAAQELEEEAAGRSVVPDKYKERYKAEGHAGNCGDWLASLLIELTTDKANGYNCDTMNAIADANGTKTDHLKTTSKGWQGRHRMTARNLLVKKVAAKGAVILPAGIGGDDDREIKAPEAWCLANAPKIKEAKKGKNKAA